MSVRVSKPWIEPYKLERAGGSKTRRWAVGYRVFLPGDTRLVRKRGFTAKGLAETYRDNVVFASLRHGGWRFDEKWRPVHQDDQPDTGISVVDAIEVFWRMHWDTIGPSQRSKVRGRLMVMAASLCRARGVVEALAEQSPKRGSKRPEPATPEAWAARYLGEAFLPGFGADVPVSEDHLNDQLREASAWLRRQSMSLSAITDVHLDALRGHLGGNVYQTRRTYWTVIQQVLTWAVNSGRLERDPSLGMVRLTRDLDAEEVDPDNLPCEDEVWDLANLARERFGMSCAALVLVCAFGALRIGEAVALRYSSFSAETGGVRIAIQRQRRRSSRRHTEDGITVSDAPLKGRTTGPRAKRAIFISGRAAAVILEHVGSLPSEKPQAHAFTDSRGRPLSTDAFRRGRWNPLVAEVFPGTHRLSGMVPHALRHFGMTMWLRQNLPLPIIQRWGGWTSLKVMLDTYAGVLPDDDEIAVSLLKSA